MPAAPCDIVGGHPLADSILKPHVANSPDLIRGLLHTACRPAAAEEAVQMLTHALRYSTRKAGPIELQVRREYGKKGCVSIRGGQSQRCHDVRLGRWYGEGVMGNLVLQRGKLDGLLRRKCLERLVNVPGWPAIQLHLQSSFVSTAVGPAAWSESVPYST